MINIKPTMNTLPELVLYVETYSIEEKLNSKWLLPKEVGKELARYTYSNLPLTSLFTTEIVSYYLDRLLIRYTKALSSLPKDVQVYHHAMIEAYSPTGPLREAVIAIAMNIAAAGKEIRDIVIELMSYMKKGPNFKAPPYDSRNHWLTLLTDYLQELQNKQISNRIDATANKTTEDKDNAVAATAALAMITELIRTASRLMLLISTSPEVDDLIIGACNLESTPDSMVQLLTDARCCE